MARFILRRLLISAVTLFGVLVVVFLITRALPGDAAAARLGPEASPEQIAALRSEYGLDKPLLSQFFTYLSNALHGDLGRSVATGDEVTGELMKRLPATLELSLWAMIFGIVLGFPLGFLAAVKNGKAADVVVRIVAVLATSLAIFWLGLLLIYFLYFRLHIFPAPVGRLPLGATPPNTVTGLYVVDGVLTGNFEAAWAAFKQLLLPALTLSLGVTATIAKMVRSAMIKTLASDYVRAARAHGVSPRRVLLVDALRNAMLPVLTVIGIIVGYLIGGNVIAESIFTWPGMGRYAYEALQSNDLEVLQGFIIIVGAIYILINLIVDVLYSVIDPRIRVNSDAS